jgi:IK cytokine
MSLPSRRYDFATEEEWQSYKATQGAMPKAAFQFGVKVADGRKGVKEMKKTDSKLDSQLGKIEKLLQEKGHDHGGAFRRERRGEADLSLPVPKKRQRI